MNCFAMTIDPNRGNADIVQEAKAILLEGRQSKAQEVTQESQIERLSDEIVQIKKMFEDIKTTLAKMPQ